MGAQNTIRLTAAGYRNAASATVTQETDKTTAVTINAQAGVITMNGASMTAGTELVFTVNNTSVGATDSIVLSLASGATTASDYTIGTGSVSAGSFEIALGFPGTGDQSDALVINFAVIGGSF